MLERGFERFSAASKELIESRARLANELKSLENDLNSLGPDWNLESLDNFDVSVSAREEIIRCQEELERGQAAKRQAEHALVRVVRALEQVKGRALEAEKAISQIPEPREKDPRVLLERRLGIRSLRNLIQNGRDLQRSGHRVWPDAPPRGPHFPRAAPALDARREGEPGIGPV